MADRWFLVQLDLERIRRNLSREDGCEYSIQSVHSWLDASGFHPVKSGWLVRERDLGAVDPSEVIHIEEHPGPA